MDLPVLPVRQVSLRLHPSQEKRNPASRRPVIAFAKAESVTGLGEDVKFRGHTGIAESEIQFWNALRDIRAILFPAGEESRRRLLRKIHTVRNRRVKERHEGGPRRLTLDWIGGAGREAHDSEAVRGDAPLRGAAANQPNGALRVGEFCTFHGVGRTGLSCQPILEYKCRYAVLAQPRCNVVAFMIHP